MAEHDRRHVVDHRDQAGTKSAEQRLTGLVKHREILSRDRNTTTTREVCETLCDGSPPYDESPCSGRESVPRPDHRPTSCAGPAAARPSRVGLQPYQTAHRRHSRGYVDGEHCRHRGPTSGYPRLVRIALGWCARLGYRTVTKQPWTDNELTAPLGRRGCAGMAPRLAIRTGPTGRSYP